MSSTTTSTPVQVIFRFLGERKGLFATNLGLRVLKDMLPFAGPILTGWAVDLLTGVEVSVFGYDLFPNDLRSLYVIAALMAALAVAKMVFGYIHTIVSAHLGRHVVEAARRDLAEASMQMALDERRRFNSGDLLDRSLADSKGLRSFTQNVIIRIISNTLRAITPVIFLFMTDWIMAAVVLSVIPLQSGLSGLLQRRLQRLTRDARQAEATHTSAVKESIDGWTSVASVGGQDWATTELQRTAAISEDAKIRKKHTTAAISAVISLFTALGVAACYAIGGWRIITSGAVGVAGASSDMFTAGDLVAFIGIAKKVYAPFRAYTKIVSSYRTGLVNLERIAEVLDAPMLDARRDGPELVVTEGTIRLDRVAFTYDDDTEPVLRSLSGRIPGRSLTVITGSSGTGKTTLLRLLMGLDQPQGGGTITIDGQDINVARLASVQRSMALVPQEPMLFTGTLGENLILGRPDTTTEELLDACHKAGLLELVRELPEGLDTEVGSGRHMLSGGQLRRMAIARALLRKPAILLLDEPTTGLDQVNSKQVLDTLRRIAQSATVLMVSHRRDPLAASDHHLILEHGAWTDGTGMGDRWRPEVDDTLTEPAEPRGANPIVSGSNDALARAEPAANGSLNGPGSARPSSANGADSPSHAVAATGSYSPTATNGSADRTGAANGRAGRAKIGQRRLDMSAMGRPINLDFIERGVEPSTTPGPRVLFVGSHRSDAPIAVATVDHVMSEVAAEPDSEAAVAAIASINPDGVLATDHRTVLGVDPAADHLAKLAVETNVLHNAIDDWTPTVIVDVGERHDVTRPGADIEIVLRYPPTGQDRAPDWLAHVGSDLRRRLKASRFSSAVSLVEADATNIAAVTGVPVIEITAMSPRHLNGNGRASEAVSEAAVAAFAGTTLAYV